MTSNATVSAETTNGTSVAGVVLVPKVELQLHHGIFLFSLSLVEDGNVLIDEFFLLFFLPHFWDDVAFSDSSISYSN